MKVLAFRGSPRRNGNTDLLLDRVLEGVRTVTENIRVIRLADLDIGPCQNCGGCDKTGRCIVGDEMENVYRDVEEADRIVIASPIFFAGLSAQTKTMIDRCQAFWCRKYKLGIPIAAGPHGRRGLLLLIGGRRRSTEGEGAILTAEAFFHSVSITDFETLRYLGVDARGEIAKHPTAFQEGFEAGKRLVAR